jgi:hypothetical protein
VIDLPGEFQILVAELVTSTREDILGLQLQREVVKKIAAIGPCRGILFVAAGDESTTIAINYCGCYFLLFRFSLGMRRRK